MEFPKPLRRWVTEQYVIWEWEWLSISLDHIIRILELPNHHKCPFDRLIVAQAIVENIPIVTPDKYSACYDVETLW